MPRYFAYGSNLDLEAMMRRCPSSRVVCRAVLRGQRVVFPLPCPEWGGGVAGLEPDADGEVHGVLYELCEEDLVPLDAYEDVAGGDYERREVEVVCDGGSVSRAWVYFALRTGGGCPPSKRYLDTIVRAARYHGLPSAYVARLMATPAVDDGRSGGGWGRGGANPG